MGSSHPGADGLPPGPTLVSLGWHRAWVRSRFGVIRGHTVCSPADLGAMCLSSWVRVSEGRGCGPARLTAPSFLPLLSCSACVLECQQAGNFHSEDFSQSEQQIPAGARGQLPHGQGLPERTRVHARAPQLLRPHSHPPREMQTSVSPGSGRTWASGSVELRRGSGRPWAPETPPQ